jgi:hypothetical protein
MATHDYNIANQGFPAFRADLNDALAAIVSNNSNATAPATTFAHMLWVDTAANPSVLKIRNADNDAWVTIGSINQTDDKFKLTPADGVSTDTISELTSAAGVTVDGVLLKDSQVSTDQINEKTSATGVTIDGVLLKDSTVVAGAGTNSAPSITTTGDTDTGIYFPAADNIGFATGGTIRGRWTTDGLCFGSDTAAANALDDYEEGTFTPTYFGETTAGTTTYGDQIGRYTKIGNLVNITLRVNVSNATGTGNILIGGLPFAVLNVGSFAPTGSILFIDLVLPANTLDVVPSPANNSTNIRLFVNKNNAGFDRVQIDASNDIYITLTYQT